MTIDHGSLAGLLGEWLPRQRWFGGKGRSIVALDVESDVRLVDGDPALHDVVLRVSYGSSRGPGEIEHYQLLLGIRGESGERLEHALIGVLDGRYVHDAAYDTELTAGMLRLLADSGKADAITFTSVRELDPTLPSRVLSSEQSNTSLVYGDDYILKVFRKVAPGINPDLEIVRALDEVGCEHIAKPLGWIEGTVEDEPATLGLMQEYLRFGTEGWSLALTSVRDLYAEGDLHADEVGGDFAAEAERLGLATAAVHHDLVTAFGVETADRGRVAALAGAMTSRLEAACEVVPELREHAPALRATYDQLGEQQPPIRIQRIHGDFHLGQAMRTESGWVLIDFEGEPARPLQERRRKMSPLRDVAGMLRSFDYAARQLLTEQPSHLNLAYRAAEWAERNREAFCDGYARGSGHDPRDEGPLLRAFELDKAVYEVVYEARNRPTWLPIPLGSIERLVGEAHD
ncbi:MAG: maltokinase N-terminal cap-like domain-containing protein [Frankiaceae bacterium]